MCNLCIKESDENYILKYFTELILLFDFKIYSNCHVIHWENYYFRELFRILDINFDPVSKNFQRRQLDSVNGFHGMQRRITCHNENNFDFPLMRTMHSLMRGTAI